MMVLQVMQAFPGQRQPIQLKTSSHKKNACCFRAPDGQFFPGHQRLRFRLLMFCRCPNHAASLERPLPWPSNVVIVLHTWMVKRLTLDLMFLVVDRIGKSLPLLEPSTSQRHTAELWSATMAAVIALEEPEVMMARYRLQHETSPRALW